MNERHLTGHIDIIASASGTRHSFDDDASTVNEPLCCITHSGTCVTQHFFTSISAQYLFVLQYSLLLAVCCGCCSSVSSFSCLLNVSSRGDFNV